MCDCNRVKIWQIKSWQRVHGEFVDLTFVNSRSSCLIGRLKIIKFFNIWIGKRNFMDEHFGCFRIFFVRFILDLKQKG